ncbi:restriction endonuclease subunit S [Shimia sp.]|uniref:restriction endonuclease subunit S n=1 Tax=Shimia sp. TaxID=1954381 RepID=UPI003297C374
MIEEIRLGDVCSKIGSGATPRGGKQSYLQEGPFSLVRSQNVYNHGFEKAGLAFISEDQAKRLNNVAVESGDVLLNITGDSVARACQVTDSVLPARVNQHVAIIRPNPEILDPLFLRYFLVQPSFQEHMFALASVGATRNALTKGMVEDFVVPARDILEQRKIAAVLGALDDKIELNRKTAATLEEMARALYRSWFVDFDPVHAKAAGRAPAHMDAQTAALFPDRFGEDGLPEGWEAESFAGYMDIKGGTQPPKSEFLYEPSEGYVRLVQIRDYDGDNHLTFVRNTPKLRKCEALDVMIGRYGASVGRIGWGLSGAYNVALVKAEPFYSGDREFVRSVCLSYEFQEYIQAISGRSAQSGFNKGDIAAFDVVAGSRRVREAFSESVLGLRLAQAQKQKENQTLATLRDTLLPRLMSGELRVGAVKEQVESMTT